MFSQLQVDRLTFLLCDGWVQERDDEDYTASWRVFAEHVAQITCPFELHCLAANLNWDYGFAGLRTVARHGNCDRGTILMLYWLGEPTDQPVDEDHAAFLSELESRYKQLPPVTIAWTPLRDSRIQESVRIVPSEMRHPTFGYDLAPLVETVRLLVAVKWFEKGALSSRELLSSFSVRTPGVDERFVATVRRLRGKVYAIGDSREADQRQLENLRAAILEAGMLDKSHNEGSSP